MGNFFGKKAVHPAVNQECDELRRLINETSSSMRIKVRLSRNQLKELMAKADLSKGNSEFGRLILQEYVEGRSTGRVMAGQGGVVAADNHVWKKSLCTIPE
ncbi:hypothetical protein OWV82_001034 [Melia azedarach]|uniref:Uncharacterized protein n=1 Tax=Melia azedarach TaxID=155640 RepID=A0ACC1YWE2_MELAZ|nr:hypothetical protein OWV82_001034 [Melia azedarach]